ncbi:MAG: hypothetical protein QOJ34_530 [Pseudonocardiales bacterium]|nr:hypothetical protein [Pseudonocardiales bacterium]
MTQPASGKRRPDSVQQLVGFVNGHLDPGYAAAAARREPGGKRRWYDSAAVVIGAGLVGFVLVVAYVSTHRDAPKAAQVHDSLVDRVRSAQQTVDGLGGRVNDLQKALERAQASALPAGDLARGLDLARLQAGLTAAAGPGVVVTLSEPAAPTASPTLGRGGTTPIGATNILTDRDVRSVVNELWHDGAEAIAVNDVRLTPTSAIRFAGEAVLVDFQPITSPYHVAAIGDADLLATNFAQSSVASRYQTLTGVDGIGFSFADAEHVALPASAPVRVRYATVPRHKRGHR